MASPDRASGIAIRLVASLLPVLLGGGAPLLGWVNPFWQLLFGSGVVIVTYILPASTGEAHWNPIGIALVPWLIAGLIYALSGKVRRLPQPARRLTIIAFLSSFVVVVPQRALAELGPLPFYATLTALPRAL